MKQYSAVSTDPHGADLSQAIVQHEKLVRWVARRQWTGGLAWADVCQVGRIGLWRALGNYDPAEAPPFPRMPSRPLPAAFGGR